MRKPGSAAKVKLNSYDDLFGSAGVQADTGQVQEIPLSELHDFKGHPFKVLDDEKMQETVESIKNYGVLMLGIVRTRTEGGYEIIAGHRRKHGCELAGLTTMPVFVKEYSDDEATVIMVDTNIQREDILPSKKARAYSMKYEAIKHQGRKVAGTALTKLVKPQGRVKRLFRGTYGSHVFPMRCLTWWTKRKSVLCRALTCRFLMRRRSNGFRLSLKKQMQPYPRGSRQN